MELPKVFAFCAVIALSFLKAHAVPVGGLLSGLFGAEDTNSKPNPVDINQLLRQYYTAQSEDALARYNPFANMGSPSMVYGQPAQAPQSAPYDPYASLSAGYPYQQRDQIPGYMQPQDTYSQYSPLSYRGELSQLPPSADLADPYSKQLLLLTSNNKDSSSHYGDLANYRSLASQSTEGDGHAQAQADSDAEAQAQAVPHTRIDTAPATHQHIPVASSFVAQRGHVEASSKLAQSAPVAVPTAAKD